MTGTFSLVVLGWGAFILSLPMVAIDTNMGGELLRGFEHRGYQCFLGSFLAPLAVPLATPLWLVISLGNVAALLAPLAVWWPALARLSWIPLTLAAVCASALSIAGERVGVTKRYLGYYVWCSALIVLGFGCWVAQRTSGRRATHSPITQV